MTAPDQPRTGPTPPGRFAPGELGEVLRLYELGEVTGVRELLGGGAGSPKALVECARGRFVLKRRAPGRDNPFRVAFSHEVMLHLRARGFCAPALIGTRGENNSLAQVEGRVYELFSFVEGEPYARRPAQARDAGRRLRELHALLAGFRPRFADPPVPPEPAAAVRRALESLGEPAEGSEIESLCQEAQHRASGLGAGPAGLLHGDYHPGNLLFRADEVAAVFDFDGVRRGAVGLDLAQAMVQCSIRRAGEGPASWPAEPETELARALWLGYARAGSPDQTPDPAALPALMALSLGVEWGDAAAMGLLGPPPLGVEVLRAVLRKARWLLDHERALRTALATA